MKIRYIDVDAVELKGMLDRYRGTDRLEVLAERGAISFEEFLGGAVRLCCEFGVGSILAELRPSLRMRVSEVLYSLDAEDVERGLGAVAAERLRNYLESNPTPYRVPKPTSEDYRELEALEPSDEDVAVARGRTRAWLKINATMSPMEWVTKCLARTSMGPGDSGALLAAAVLDAGNIAEVIGGISGSDAQRIVDAAVSLMDSGRIALMMNLELDGRTLDFALPDEAECAITQYLLIGRKGARCPPLGARQMRDQRLRPQTEDEVVADAIWTARRAGLI